MYLHNPSHEWKGKIMQPMEEKKVNLMQNTRREWVWEKLIVNSSQAVYVQAGVEIRRENF